MKILNVIGTRPEAIKMAILHKLLLEHEKFEPILCLTGQHTDLVDDVLGIYSVTPHYCTFLVGSYKSMADSMGQFLISIQEIVDLEKPKLIIVQGDTLSSYCGAMVGFLNQIPIAHVEAGLRTHNKWSPYPEEIFRKFNDALADIHFAASPKAISNLKEEGISDSIYLTGNTGIDALLYMKDRIVNKQLSVSKKLEEMVGMIKRSNQKLIVLTMHRREAKLALIPKLLKEVNMAIKHLDCQIIFPVHSNPIVRKAISEITLDDSIHCVDQLAYHDFVWLMIQSDLILTDSGGIQEEAPYLGKPVIVLREVTERQEVLKIGINKLYKQEHLQKDISEMLNAEVLPKETPYGNGNASSAIIKILEKKYIST